MAAQRKAAASFASRTHIHGEIDAVETPIQSAPCNTALGERVRQWQAGFTVDDQSPDAIDKFLGSITREEISSVRKTMDKHGAENLMVDMQPLFSAY